MISEATRWIAGEALQHEDHQQRPEEPAEAGHRHRTRGIVDHARNGSDHLTGQQRDRHAQHGPQHGKTHRQQGASGRYPHAVPQQSQHSTDRNHTHRQKHPNSGHCRNRSGSGQ
jgi:hypothetical protein